VSTELIGCTA